MNSPFTIILIVVASLCQLSHAAVTPPPPTEKIAAPKLQEDLNLLKKSIVRVHPDLGFSTDTKQLAAAFHSLERQLKNPMTPDQAWRAFSALNPVFNDAHMQVAMNGYSEQAAEHIKAGGGFFPFEVQVNVDGDVYIRSEMGGGISQFSSMRIEKINGRSARDVARELLALTMGDNPALRANLLSERWWRFYCKAYGARDNFDLTVATADGRRSIRVAAARALPLLLTDATSFDRVYQFAMLNDRIGLLTIKSFLWPDKKLFHAFTEKVFTQLREAKASTLIIDIRDNGGGDDDMWKEGILRYIANKPYQHCSTYLKMVIEGRQSGTEKVGDVVASRIQSWEQPELDNPLHFSGKTYVLVGRTTYSSSILFANTMQDFSFGTLVGEAGYARTRQSGGIQSILLPHTGLSLIVPRFILDRPSGLREPELLQPDIVLPDNPFNSRGIIEALTARVVGGK